eukprot:s1791_g6.t1
MASCFGTLPPSGWEKALRPPVTGARAARAEGKCAKVVKAAVRPVSAVCRSKRLRTLPLLRASRNLEVMERYLKYRWTDHVPSLKEPPEGPHAIAAMRLLCMAQANGRTVVDAFNLELPQEDILETPGRNDKEVLSVEMSRTGCAGQSFSPTLVPKEILSKPAGPAFVIYYGPAFGLGSATPRAQQASVSAWAVLFVGSIHPVALVDVLTSALNLKKKSDGLRILAEIYRCSRELWPEALCPYEGEAVKLLFPPLWAFWQQGHAQYAT